MMTTRKKMKRLKSSKPPLIPSQVRTRRKRKRKLYQNRLRKRGEALPHSQLPRKKKAK
jgi:hypothetical protein